MRSIVTLLLLATPAVAQELQFREGEARLTEQKVNVEIHHRTAVTTLTQVFLNPTSRNGEGVYVFRVPRDGALMDFTMWIAGRKMQGQMLDRDRATRIYGTVRNRMRPKDPGIVEEMARGLYRVRIFPIPAKAKMKFEIKYTSTVAYEDGQCTYSFPLRIKNKQTKHLDKILVNVNVKTPTVLRKVECPNHQAEIKRKGNSEANIQFGRVGEMTDDFIVNWTFSEEDVVFRAHREGKDHGYFLFGFTPKMLNGPHMPRNLVFLVDTSASMKPKALETVKKALLDVARQLKKNDRMEVVTFNQSVRRCRNLKDLPKFLAETKPEGRTDFEEALRLLASEPARDFRVAVLISDGHASAGELAAQKLAATQIDRNTILCGVRTGAETKERILETLAETTGGRCLAANGDVNDAFGRILKHYANAVMTDVKIDWGESNAFAVHRDAYRILFAGDQPVVFGRYKNPGDHIITLTGNVGGERVEHTWQVSFPKKAEGWASTAYQWAGRQIRSHLAAIAQGENEGLKNAVIALSREYHIVTPFTAFLILEDDQMYADFDVENIARDEKRMFKDRKKKRLEEGDSDDSPSSLPSATPGVKPVDPYNEGSTAKHSLLKALRELAGQGTSGDSNLGRMKLKEIGTNALTLLALAGAANYEIPGDDLARLEDAVDRILALFSKNQDASSGRIGEEALDHALATLAIARVHFYKSTKQSTEMLQKAVAWLCDNTDEWMNKLGTAAFGTAALKEARLLKLEVEKEIFTTARAMIKNAKVTERDPLRNALYIIGRDATSKDILSDRSVKVAANRINARGMAGFDPLTIWACSEALVSWKPRSAQCSDWMKKLKDALRLNKVKTGDVGRTALYALTQEAYDRRND